jgi:hypothetical protein
MSAASPPHGVWTRRTSGALDGLLRFEQLVGVS